MAKVEIVIEGGPYPGEYRLGLFDLEILPRKGESVFHDIGDSMVFEVRDVWHFINPKTPIQIRLAPLDEKNFEDVGTETGFFLSYQTGRNPQHD
jgi:hypothetical protein